MMSESTGATHDYRCVKCGAWCTIGCVHFCPTAAYPSVPWSGYQWSRSDDH